VAFSFLTPAGCRYEAADREGLAAMTCDMSLRGAGERDNRAFHRDLETLGVERHESVSNAHATYSGATLAANLLPALELYADLLRRPQMPEKDLEASRLVIMQELMSIEDEPAQKLMIELRRHYYDEPFGRASYGRPESIVEVTMDDVLEFSNRNRRPNGTILGVAGRFDWAALKEQVGQLLGDWAAVDEPAIMPGEPGGRNAHLTNESNQTQIGIAYKSVPYRDPNYYQASGAVGVLSGGMSSRLFTEVREKRGLCYSVYATSHTLRDQGSVLCYAGASAERAQETLDVILGELARLSQGVHAGELDRLKARIKSGLIMQHESSSARSSAVARDWHHLGRARTLEEIGRLVDELSCESINAFLEEHPPADFTVVTLGPNPLEISVAVS
jgi:predicted Zn-dependent peptidase